MEVPSAITALSVEILQMIIEECIPEGFEAFSLTCQAVHEASKRYIPDYQRLKERFREISYTDREPPEPMDDRMFWKALPGNPLAHILELTRNTLAFRYVEVADLEHRNPSAPWFKPKRRIQVENEFMDEVFDIGDLFHLLRRSLSRNDFHSLYKYLLLVYQDGYPDSQLGCKISDFEPPTCPFVDLICWHSEPTWTSAAESDDSSLEMDNLDTWFETVMSQMVGNVDYATTCLLSLLPNVQRLNLRFTYSMYLNEDEMYDNESERMWTFLSAIASNANNPMTRSAGLSKLVSLSHSGGCVHQNAPLRSYIPLFTIDSLKTVILHALVLSEDKSWPKCPSISMFGKNLEFLMLTECIIREGDTWEGCLASLISRMPKLKALRLHPRQLEDDSRSFNVPKVMDVIAKHLGQSLEIFSLSGTLQPGRTSGFIPGNATMKGFKQLREVELDVRGFRPGGPWRYPSLVQFLPASVVNVFLLLTGFNSKNPAQMCDTTMEVLNGLFEGFEAQHQAKLPNLEEIDFRGRLTDEFFEWLDEFDENNDVAMGFQEDMPAAEHML
jgi:hypothetical protein